MKISGVLAIMLLAVSADVYAVDGGAIVGGAIGGAAGVAIGSDLGGRNGAIIGGAIGGATGAAIGSQNNGSAQASAPKKHRVREEDDGDDERFERRRHRDNGLHLGQRKHRHHDDD